MTLFKYLSLNCYNNCLLYVEGNQFIHFGFFSTRKLKVLPYFLIFHSYSSLFIFSSIFSNSSNFLLHWKYLYPILKSFFFGSFFGYYHGFRLIGRGYKAYLFFNNFVFRLGYSHNVYYTLPLHYKTSVKDKMKNFWTIRGVDINSLSVVVSLIRGFRIPNTYMHKGIYKMNDLYKIKATKKGNIL